MYRLKFKIKYVSDMRIVSGITCTPEEPSKNNNTWETMRPYSHIWYVYIFVRQFGNNEHQRYSQSLLMFLKPCQIRKYENKMIRKSPVRKCCHRLLDPNKQDNNKFAPPKLILGTCLMLWFLLLCFFTL